VTNELGGERVDIIPWTQDIKQFITSTLAPVEVQSIELNEEHKTALVKVPEDQLSLTIGKEGQNVRLSSQLTGYRIEAEGVVVEGREKILQEAKPKPDGDVKKKTKKVKKETNQVSNNTEPETQVESEDEEKS
jgi:N utilization substance protein A